MLKQNLSYEDFFETYVKPFLSKGREFTSDDVLEEMDLEKNFTNRLMVGRNLGNACSKEDYLSRVDRFEEGRRVYRYEPGETLAEINVNVRNGRERLFEDLYQEITMNDGLEIREVNKALAKYVEEEHGSSEFFISAQKIEELTQTFLEEYDVEKDDFTYQPQ